MIPPFGLQPQHVRGQQEMHVPTSDRPPRSSLLVILSMDIHIDIDISKDTHPNSPNCLYDNIALTCSDLGSTEEGCGIPMEQSTSPCQFLPKSRESYS